MKFSSFLKNRVKTFETQSIFSFKSILRNLIKLSNNKFHTNITSLKSFTSLNNHEKNKIANFSKKYLISFRLRCYSTLWVIIRTKELWKKMVVKGNLKTGITLCHLYQSLMTAEKDGTKQRTARALCDKLSKICKSHSFAWRKIFLRMLFWHLAMMALFNPQWCFQLPKEERE